jgi:hypothetical protein
LAKDKQRPFLNDPERARADLKAQLPDAVRNALFPPQPKAAAASAKPAPRPARKPKKNDDDDDGGMMGMGMSMPHPRSDHEPRHRLRT